MAYRHHQWAGRHAVLCRADHPGVVGIISAATAFAWANDLYDNYAWWFRVSGLAVLAILVWWALRHRNRCSVNAIRRLRWRLMAVLAIAVGTYGVLSAVTTWFGTFV